LQHAPDNHPARARRVYTIGFWITAVMTWLLRDYADELFAARPDLFAYCVDPDLKALCAGTSAALRFSFANFVYFGTHAVLLVGLRREDDPRVALHASAWLWKLAVWGGTIIGFFFLPDNAVVGFAQAARFGAGAFLVFQIINILDVIYQARGSRGRAAGGRVGAAGALAVGGRGAGQRRRAFAAAAAPRPAAALCARPRRPRALSLP
jgi:hypothetical protein